MESWNELIESVFRAKSSYPAQLTESIITISVINPFQARFLFQNLKSDPALTLQHPTLPCYYFDLFSKRFLFKEFYTENKSGRSSIQKVHGQSNIRFWDSQFPDHPFSKLYIFQ